MVDWTVSLFAGMGLLFLFSTIGLPIAFSLLLSAFLCIGFFLGFGIALTGLKVSLLGAAGEGALLAVPLFVLMASVFIADGTNTRAYNSFAKLFGGVQSGLLVATNWLLAFLGALMGSSSAAISMVAQMGAPALKARGYSNPMVGGVLAGSGGLAVIIPPSILMIIYSITMQVPVIPLFAAGFVPGILLAIGFNIWIVFATRRNPPREPTGVLSSHKRSTIMGATSAAAMAYGFNDDAIAAMRGELPPLKRLWAMVELLPLIGVMSAMLGSMFLGFASVMEGAAIGVLGAICVGLFSRTLTVRGLTWALWNTAQISGFILFLVLAGRYFGMFFSLTDISSQFVAWIENLPFGGMTLLLAIMGIFLLLGCIMETISMMLVLVPIAASALVAEGFDPIMLGVLFVINMEVSLITPPIGGNLFVLAGMTRSHGITFEQIVRGVLPYVIVNLVVILLIAQFPALTTYTANLVR